MARKYQAYPEYKVCDGDWIFDIPEDWEIFRGKYLFEIKKRIAGGLGHDVLSITQKGIKIKDTESGDGQLSMDYSKYQLVEPGDFAMNHMDLLTGYVDISDFYGVTSPDYRVFSPKKTADCSRFFLYVLQMCYTQKIFFKYGQGASHLGRWRLPTEEFKNFCFPCPPELDREKIADFLDYETAQIDTLIDKQQQLIQLLKEKRQAVINHAVTKGLNPDAPMKDSGIEWLGKVPEHWGLVPLKYLCSFSGGGTPDKSNLSYWVGGKIPWVSPKDMKSFWITKTQDQLTDEAVRESSTSFVEIGALLVVVRSGILQRTIPIGINTVRVTLNQDMKALVFNERISSEYAANYILGNVPSLLLEWSKEGATVESIEHEFLSGSLIPVPPQSEQTLINRKVTEKSSYFQILEERAVKGIALLQERRSALISAAVTGKIDVRGWQPPAKSQPC